MEDLTPTEGFKVSDINANMVEKRQAARAVLVFPLLIVIAGVIGVAFPDTFIGLNSLVPWLLGLIMFAMGLTLKLPDLKILRTAPHAVAIGFFCQYTIMPFTAFGIALLLNFEPLLIVGMVLMGSVPGGASSNIVAYLANGNVALSVTMTSLSTLLAPVVTPFLVLLLAGNYLPVDFMAMLLQIMQMVIVPVVLGITVQIFARRLVNYVAGVVPWFAVSVLFFVIVGIMAGSAEVVLGSALLVIIAVVMQNAVAFSLGYAAARLGRLKPRERRAVAVEVGMQNGGLAAALANENYAPLASLPAAIGTIWHNVGGAILALIFGVADRKADTSRAVAQAPTA